MHAKLLSLVLVIMAVAAVVKIDDRLDNRRQAATDQTQSEVVGQHLRPVCNRIHQLHLRTTELASSVSDQQAQFRNAPVTGKTRQRYVATMGSEIELRESVERLADQIEYYNTLTDGVQSAGIPAARIREAGLPVTINPMRSTDCQVRQTIA